MSVQILTEAIARRYAATFDREVRDVGPQGIHWCLNTPETTTGDLGVDGHPLRTEQADLPRRMWASSDLRFHAPIAVGAKVEQVSRVEDSSSKQGKTGRLVFMTVVHAITADGTPAVSERQTIVYRDAAPAGEAPPPPLLEPQRWDWERTLVPQPPLLFRYSALTFNSHRIHYDLPYAVEEEGYPGLVVHGPLMASLLLDLVDRQLGPDALERFSFRAVSPAIAGAPLHLLGRRDGETVTLAMATAEGGTIMTAVGRVRAAPA